MTPLILANPLRGGIRVLEVLQGLSVTVAWSDRSVLEDSVEAVLGLNGNTLFVDTSVEGSASAAMAHQQQVMGMPQFVLVVVDDVADLIPARDLARAVLAALPASAVLVIGEEDAQRAMRDVAAELELVPPLSTTLHDLPAVAAELLATARWESVS